MDLSGSKFHFIGIGGIGMSGLAELLCRRGAKVSGSDIGENAQTQRLKELGAEVFLGHSAANISHQDVVVFSSAINEDNEEMVRARELKIPIIPRAEALAEAMRLKRGIAVAGTHGKTTTSSLAASVFVEGELDPTVVVGGRLQLFKSTARLGKGEWFIAEADESDGSFQRLSPELAIITNIDEEHLDHFGTFENVKMAFKKFAEKIPFYGSLVVCGDDPVVREVYSDFAKPKIFYGFNDDNDYIARVEGEKLAFFKNSGGGLEKLVELNLPIPGRHNSLNALAAFICGLRAGLSPEQCALGLQKFSGVDRRFQSVGSVSGALVIDDYGHHPTEIKAVLKTAAEKYRDKEIVCVFQPHRIRRTQHCWDALLTSFTDAKELIVTDIYPAGEAPITGIDAASLVAAIEHDNASHMSLDQELAKQLVKKMSAEKVLIIMGAGNISKFAHSLVENHGTPA